jgi:hypothetical protein
MVRCAGDSVERAYRLGGVTRTGQQRVAQRATQETVFEQGTARNSHQLSRHFHPTKCDKDASGVSRTVDLSSAIWTLTSPLHKRLGITCPPSFSCKHLAMPSPHSSARRRFLHCRADQIHCKYIQAFAKSPQARLSQELPQRHSHNALFQDGRHTTR